MGGSFLSPCRAFSSLLKERSRELFIGSDRGRVREARCRLVATFFLEREKQRTFTWQRAGSCARGKMSPRNSLLPFKLEKGNHFRTHSRPSLLRERAFRPGGVSPNGRDDR